VSSVIGEYLVSVMTSTTMRRPFPRGGADCSTRLSMLYYWIFVDSLKSHVSRRHPRRSDEHSLGPRESHSLFQKSEN
jgi:hypothetical protein